MHVDHRGLYLFAFCHRSGAVKTFRLDRMDEVRLTARTFSPPSESDAGKFVRPMFGMWASGRPTQVRFEVTVGPPLVAYLTGMGPEVSEIEPEELARAVEEAHRRALKGSS